MRMFLRGLSVFSLAFAISLPGYVLAQQPTVAPSVESSRAQNSSSQGDVYLRFVGRTWDDVLAAVAHQASKTLVMPDVPSGRLTRYDHRSHNLSDAVRILNHELNSTGYQIMPKGDYLIVLRDDRFRPKYTRPVLPAQTADQIVQTSGQSPSQPQVVTAGQSRTQPQPRPEPQLLTNQSTAATNSANGASAATPSPLQTPSPSAKPQALMIEPSFGTAVALSRQVYQAYGTQARLINSGPLGLPAFDVSLPQQDSETKTQQPTRTATIGIDVPNNQLILVAGQAEQTELLELFEQLDASHQPTAAGHNRLPLPRLLPVSPTIHAAVTKRLPRILAQVAQSDQAGQPVGNPMDSPNLSDQPGNLAPPLQQPAPGQDEDLNAILDRLRGDVSIEALNELGLLILRGNEADVDGVMKIIAAIEKLSAGTTPEIHLRHLQHVNSEALADLLNSVYESVDTIDQRANRNNRRVNAIPVVQPNSVLIIAPSIDLAAALALIDELDQPNDPRQHVQFFRLQHAAASTAVTVIEEFYEERGGLGTRLRITDDQRTNTLIVQATPQDLKEIAILIRDIDQDESHSVSRLQLFPLKNAVAEELAEFINTAVEEALTPVTGLQFGGQQQAGNNLPKSFVLEFLAGSGSQAELIRSGLLTDIRVSADPRTNSLAVIAPERSLPLFAALISSLDRPADAVAEVKVFTLTHADANSALTLLQELFDQADADSPVGVNLAGTADSGSALLPIRFSVDVRSNSILAIGGQDALTVVEAILLRLDNEAPRKRLSTVLKLKNSPAADVAETINLFLESQRELNEIDPDLVSAVEQIDREVIIVPELLSNNLLISATPEWYGEIVSIAQELDAAPPQVIIQALLVEVQLDNVDELGVELGFQDSVLFNRSLINNLQTITNTVTNQNIQTTTQQIISQEGSPGFLFNNPSLFPNLGNNISPASNPSAVGSQGLANFGVGRVNGDLGYGGLVLSASSESVSLLVRALAQQRNVQVLSRPQIRTVDSQLAQIQVGQRVPIVNGVTITATGVANPNIEYDEAGIILSVTPRINPDGQIVMEVVAERSAYRDGGVPIFTDAVTGNTIQSPVKDISVARATVGVSDGQTIVLGGMISETDSATTRKVPWLGDIPVVGRLFRYDSAQNTRSELLIFLTPRVLRDQFDNESIKDIEAGRIHFFREEAEELHGPLFGVPASEQFLPESIIQPDGTPFDSETFSDSEYEMTPLPLLPEELPGNAIDDNNIPRTIVPDDSLKPMSLNNPQQPPKAPAEKKRLSNSQTQNPGVTRVFNSPQ